MQGEADAIEADHAASYVELYDKLLSDFRGRFGSYLADCVYVDAGISEIWAYYRQVNQAKRDYADRFDDCRFLDTVGAGLTTRNEPVGAPDIYHYDSDSVIRLGRMFAQAIP